MNASVLEKLNGDLLQLSRTRYDSYASALDDFIALAYWKGLISGVILSVVVPPSYRKFLSVTELATPLGRFLVVFIWGLDIQCA